MAWESAQPLKGATLWRDKKQGFWAVTRDRKVDGTVYHVWPNDGVNHLRTRKAALEQWRRERRSP
jgi:hypothetical protein